MFYTINKQTIELVTVATKEKKKKKRIKLVQIHFWKKKIEEDKSDDDEEPHGLIVLFSFAHCTFWFYFIVADTFDSEQSSIIDSPKRSWAINLRRKKKREKKIHERHKNHERRSNSLEIKYNFFNLSVKLNRFSATNYANKWFQTLKMQHCSMSCFFFFFGMWFG